jgi:hypothetical protein
MIEKSLAFDKVFKTISKFFGRSLKPKLQKAKDHAPTFSRRGEINLGDLVLALEQISTASIQERELIANLLGFQLNQTDITLPQQSQYQANKSAWNRTLLKERPKSRRKSPPDFTPRSLMPPKPNNKPDLSGNILQPTMQVDNVARTHEISADSAIQNAQPLAELKSQLPMPRHTLFSHRTYRGIVSATTSRMTDSKTIDIPKLISKAIRCQPLHTLPCLPRFTSRNGCQLLLDFHEALMPWWDDMHALIQQFHQVLGEASCPIYEFDQTPVQAFRWTETGKQPWQPVPGKPVIIASDLSVLHTPDTAARPGRLDWLEIIQACEKVQAPLIVLFPLHPQRCPYRLDQRLTLIHWHPATTASIVNRTIKQMKQSDR